MSIYSTTILSDSPLGYWRLGELSGATAVDSTGNGHDGAYVGVTQGQAGAIAGDNDAASVFAGTGDSRVNGPAGLAGWPNGRAAMTQEAWVKYTTQHNPAEQNTVCGWLNDHYCSLHIRSDLTMRFALELTGAPSVFHFCDSPLPYGDGAWHHVAGVYESAANAMRLYVDGGLVMETALPASSTLLQPVDLFTIGATHNQNQWDYTGCLDEVAIYPQALSAARVLAHYRAGLTRGIAAGAIGSVLIRSS